MKSETGKPPNPGAQARRVLVILAGELGDFMLSLGALKAIRAHHPRAQITLMTETAYRPFLEKCPFVDVVDDTAVGEGPRGEKDAAQKLSAAAFDMVYDLDAGRAGSRASALFRAMKPKPLWSGDAERCAFAFSPDAAQDRVGRLAAQLASAGLNPSDSDGPVPAGSLLPDLGWIDDALGHLPRLQPAYFGLAGPFMVLAPSRASRSGHWPNEQYTRLASRLADSAITPVIVGGTAEADRATAIQRAEPRVKNLVTRTDLFQLVTLIRQAKFIVGDENGALQIAGICRTPGVALLRSGPTLRLERPASGAMIVMEAPELAQIVAIGARQADGRLESSAGVWDMLTAMRLVA